MGSEPAVEEKAVIPFITSSVSHGGTAIDATKGGEGVVSERKGVGD